MKESTPYLHLSFDMNERHLRSTRQEILTRYAEVFGCVAVEENPMRCIDDHEHLAYSARFEGEKKKLDALLHDLGLRFSDRKWAIDDEGEYSPIDSGFAPLGPDWFYAKGSDWWSKDGDMPRVLHNMTAVSTTNVDARTVVRTRWYDGWIEGVIVGVDKKWVTLRVTAFSHNTTGCERGMLTRIIVPGLQVDDTDDRIVRIDSGYFGVNSDRSIVEAMWNAKIDDRSIDYLRHSSF